MKQKMTILLVILFLGCGEPSATADADYYEACRKVVLSQNKTMQPYFFSRVGKDFDEMTVVYLGIIKMNSGRLIKVLNCTNCTGAFQDAKRSAGNVFIYDGGGHKIGNYYVGGNRDLPSRIEEGKLVFAFNNEVCNQQTEIDLRDSIPTQIFIRCTEAGGDFYRLWDD